VDKTLHEKPIAATHWSTRTLAAQLGVGPTTIRRIWQRNGLKPHRQATFKLSRDPRFEDKLLDVVGLYLNPPERALVLSCDEKSHPLAEASSRNVSIPHPHQCHGVEGFPPVQSS
jgi:hypothetical protein